MLREEGILAPGAPEHRLRLPVVHVQVHLKTSQRAPWVMSFRGRYLRLFRHMFATVSRGSPSKTRGKGGHFSGVQFVGGPFQHFKPWRVPHRQPALSGTAHRDAHGLVLVDGERGRGGWGGLGKETTPFPRGDLFCRICSATELRGFAHSYC